MLLLFTVLLAVDPNQSSILLKNALLALKQGHTEEARSGLEQASRLDPNNPYVWSALAEAYGRAKETTLASSAAEKAERIGGDNPIVCHALAMYYSGASDFGHAARLERTFAKSDKADGGAISRTAELFLKAGDAKSGLEFAREAQQRNGSAMNEDLLAQALVANGKQEEALAHLQSAWQADTDNTQIAFDWLQLLLKNGDFAHAAAVANTVLGRHPDDGQMLLALGVARYGQRRFDEAIVTFLHVIAVDRNVERPYRFLGRMLDQAGSHLPEITHDFQERAAQNPGDAKAHLLLAKALLAGDNKNAQAEPLIRTSITLDPRDWESHYELGVLLEGQHRFSEAATELARTTELAPNEPEPHYHLARVYDRLGQSERAKAERELHQRLTSPMHK